MRARLRINDGSRRWWILAAASAGIAMAMLDETVVGVALATIRSDLGMSQLLSHWVVNTYLLSLTVFVAGAGRLGDVIGERPVMLAGAVIFGVGSLASGLAQSGEWILVSRAVQGAGAAVVFSITVAMIGVAFSGRELARAIGIYGLVATLALGIGPFVGGVLTEVVTWRLIFFINLPVVVAVIVIIAVAWREPESASPRPRFDFRGQLVLLALLLPLVLALMQAPDWGWGSTTVLALLATSALALPAFAWTELGSREPLIEIDLLRRATVVASNLVVSCAQFSKIAVIVFGALYLQDRLDLSPLLAGTALLVAMVLTPVSGPLAGRLVERYGNRRPTLAGVAVGTAGLAWLAIFVPEESFPLLVPGLVLWGVSLQFFFTGPETAMMGAVPAKQRGEAGGILSTTQMLGGALAVAVLGGAVIDSGDYSAVFGIAAGVTAAVWVASFLLMDRAAREHPAPVAGPSAG